VEAELTRFGANSVTIPLYIETAKNFLQLSTGLLALSVIFREKVLGENGPSYVSPALVSSWVCLLLSIGAGALYQYRAVKLLESFSPFAAKQTLFDAWFKAHVLYASMLVAFFLGAVLFAAAASRILGRRRSDGG
jgi:hypothetical protein